MKAYETVGMQKICSDVDQAMKRARNVAAPINAQRFDIQTLCQKTGSCLNCLSPDTVCCQFFITRYSRHQSHIHVILVNNHLGLKKTKEILRFCAIVTANRTIHCRSSVVNNGVTDAI